MATDTRCHRRWDQNAGDFENLHFFKGPVAAKKRVEEHFPLVAARSLRPDLVDFRTTADAARPAEEEKMKPLSIALAACLFCGGALAQAQDRFGYRPNYTALRQHVPYRAPSYSDYYQRYNGELPPYSHWQSQPPASDYRYSGGISDRYGWSPIYQFVSTSGDQLLTAGVQNEDAGAMLSYTPDGMFFVHRTGGAGRIPLFRYLESDSHHSFTTTRRGMQDAWLEGILGYIDTAQTRGTVPLFGWYDPYWGRYLVTTNSARLQQQNFEYLGVLGYVMPGQ
jgi:hypothetical protein